MVLPTTCTPLHLYYPDVLQRSRTPKNVRKRPKTPENVQKRSKTPENAQKRSKTPENARKRPKTPENARNVRNVQKRPKFSSEGNAAPILSGVRGAAAARLPPSPRPSPRPRPRRANLLMLCPNTWRPVFSAEAKCSNGGR